MGGVPLALTAIALVAWLAWLVPNAHAQPSASAHEAVREQSRVAVDWAAVHDEDIQRCGLAQLRAGTIERLVAEGHAIVESVDASGIRVAVASSGEGLQIRV